MKAAHGFSNFALLSLIGMLFVAFVMPTAAAAQRPKTAAEKKKEAEAPPAKKADAAPKGDDDKDKPEVVDIPTEDGVLMRATYFKSKMGKNAPAVILLHGLGEKRGVFDELAFDLQDRGYAVLSLDFRGHGKSTQWVAKPQAPPKAGAGKLDYHDLRTKEQFLTLLNDIEAAKKFLVRRNNAQELNVAKLAVVGTEMGASLGILWSFKDWQYTTTVGFTGKQGQDVQTLVLISPKQNFNGLAISKELAYLQQRMPIQVVAGKKETKVFSEAEKMYQSANKARPNEPPASELLDIDTKLQGSKLLDSEHFDVNKSIIKYLDVALRQKAAPWAMREISEAEAAGP